MLLTPRVIRTHELTQKDLNPIYIGSQGNLGLTGPPPLIAPPAEPEPATAPTPAPGQGAPTPKPTVPPGSSPVPGTVLTPQAAAPTPGPAGGAQIIATPPGAQFQIAGGPYTVPITVAGVSRLSTVSLTMTFNPQALRVRAIQEGSFMRQGGVNAAFTQQVDSTIGRIDITITRPADMVGASGTGLLAVVLFDATAAGA